MSQLLAKASLHQDVINWCHNFDSTATNWQQTIEGFEMAKNRTVTIFPSTAQVQLFRKGART